MGERFSFGAVNIDVSVGRDRSQFAPQPETPFRIAILGDFSGRANRGICDVGEELAGRRAVLVDRDDIDQLPARLGARVELLLDGTSLSLRFTELEDFHPDRIFERAAIFRKLRQTHDRLADPETFAQVLAEMGLGSATRGVAVSGPAAPSRATSDDVQQLAAGDLLERAIRETPGQPDEASSARAPEELREFVRRVVEPHLIRTSPRQAEMIATLDRATSAQMRTLLHVSDFQALESAWRALFFLVRRVETDELLKLYLLDVSKDELAADLAGAEDLSSTGTYKLLVEQTVRTPSAQPWAVLVGNYTFGPAREDVKLLGQLAKIARAAGAPFLAAASPRVLGCQSVTETPHPRDWKPQADSEDARAWGALRKLPEASYVGLALPRFLLRIPYGKDTDRTELFDFEEMLRPPVHEDYLWGNPAFACTLLLAQAYREYGWEMRPGVYSQIDGLPLHFHKDNGESQVKPCAEVLLTQDAAEEILNQGPMPLASLRGRDAVRLVRFQSIADPPRALAGGWD